MLKDELLLEILELAARAGGYALRPVERVSERAVVVFTDKRGVFYGYTDTGVAGNVKLRSARNCNYWAKQPSGRQHGFMGLATHGPADGSRVGVAADVELAGVTCIAECTPEAVEKWESSTWESL